MEDRSESGGAAVLIAIIMILVLLLLAGGVGTYYVRGRQQMVLVVQAERARMAEAEARLQAEQARLNAELAASKRSVTNDQNSAEDPSDSIRAAVESTIRAQEEAWNRGDLDAFMEHYWTSAELTFSSNGKTTRGWSETRNAYREQYPTREKMGHRRLGELAITPLGDSAAMVVGQWNVDRESEPLSGNFSLVIRKFDSRWQIVHDHTSRRTD